MIYIILWILIGLAGAIWLIWPSDQITVRDVMYTLGAMVFGPIFTILLIMSYIAANGDKVLWKRKG